MDETILIIDDDEQTLDMFATTLAQPNYAIVTALGGQVGVEKYSHIRPAITFVDLWMAGKDGFQVLKEIRAQDPDAEVVLMTSHSDKNTILAALRAYASDFVLKPIEPDMMDNILRRAEERLQVKRQLHAAQAALQTSHTKLEQQVAARTAELQAANTALRESERNLRRAQQVAHVGSWQFNLNKGSITVSEEARRIYGLEEHEWSIKEVQTIPLPEYRGALDAALEGLIKEGRPYDIEFRIRRPTDGVILDIHSVAEYDSERRIVIGVIQDITAQKKSEKALLESEARYRELAGSITDVFFAMDQDLRYIFWNQASEQLTGIMAKDALGKTIYDLFPDEAGGKAAAVYQEVIATHQPRTFINEHRLGDTSSWFEINAYPTQQGVSVFVKDITERKQVEAALRESEERFRAAFYTSPDAININRLSDGLFIEANEGFLRLMGYTWDEVAGRSSLGLNIWADPRDRDHLVAGLQTNGVVENLETQFRRKDGEVRTGLMSARILRLGGELCVLSITRDITERSDLEQQLRRQERLAAVGQLAAGIAHDFRNLLTTIMLYAQLSLRKPGVPPQVGQALDIIHGESQKAATLVQQILDFSSRAMITLRPLALDVGITEIVATLQRTLPENIHLTVTTGAEDYTIAGDMGQIQQVVMNLALNSRDAMPAGGDLCFILSRLKVEPEETPPVADMPPGEWVCLAVADTGTGMSEAVAAHLFEPFFTTKEVGKGTGLGLAQVYGIVRQHRGYIGVKTAEGAGTTFTLYLPANDARPTAAKPLLAAPPGQGETILLVEDNDKLRAAGESLLETLGYHVITAKHGREALGLYAAEGSQIDLVITDIVMPEMGGKELLTELRRLAPQVKALGVTGYAMQENLETLQQAGFLDVLNKPFDIETLAQVIRRVLAAS